jgi:peptidyl-prolyl cis-trans isomerase D
VIKITAQKGSSKRVKVAVVDKAVGSSSKTQQEAYAKATSFLSAASDAKAFDEEAKKLKYNKLIAENVTGSQGFIPGLENARSIIQWAYGADKGDVGTQIFETGNKFVVAKLVRVSKKGILSLEDVKKQIEPMVRNAVKAKQLTEKMNAALAGASRIEQVAQKLGRQVMPVQNIVFANPILPALGQENKVVGTVFGLQPGKLSKAIEGSQAVFAVVVDGFNNPVPLANVFKQKEQIAQALTQRSTGEAFRVLREKSDIKDNRVKFY